VLEIVGTVVASVVLGWSWSDALQAFTVTNGLMGAAFALCGLILSWHRPRNPIGWLFLAGGVAQAAAALCAPAGQLLLRSGAPTSLLRAILTLFAWSWPLSIGLCLPVALLLFPDGRPASPRWRWVVIGVIATAPLFSIEVGASPQPLAPGLPLPYLTLPFYDALQPLWTIAEIRTAAAMALSAVALFVRYRRGTETERRQLLWLLLAVVTAVAATLPWGFVAGTPIVVLFAIPLIPIAVTVAIVRHQLLDIRLVISRALAWLLLSLAVLVAYVALVALLDLLVAGQLGRSALVTVVLALVAAPVLPRLQRLVDRAMYGDRRNPARVVSRIGDQLATAELDLRSIVSTIRAALRLPYAALERDGSVVTQEGEAPAETESVPLLYNGRTEGTLTIGLRRGERRMSAADQRVLSALANPLAVALHATATSAELQASRERIVAATAEERRRLRRELHDGLGPTLTGIAFAADAAGNLVIDDPARSAELLGSLSRDARAALADVRRLVDDLRPPALDELGLVGALRRRAEQLAWRADGVPVDVRLDVPAEVPQLPAAVEVATYRIATEALTNVVRHSQATAAWVRVSCGDRLDVSVTDNGPPNGAWVPGVGLRAMQERAAELGGVFQAGPSAGGGRVAASFPLATLIPGETVRETPGARS
jgi:signal transduction histidine kinase